MQYYTNRVFSGDCKRQSDIEAAWGDAIKLVISLPKVDFNDVAVVDFFGPPALNKDYQSKIQAVFDSAKTFGQGWKITPTPFKVQINVGCGANIDRELDSRCKAKGPGLKAYTWNTKNSDGTGNKCYEDKGSRGLWISSPPVQPGGRPLGYMNNFIWASRLASFASTCPRGLSYCCLGWIRTYGKQRDETGSPR
ncbi:hypothetical protein CHU98_g5675 [Xylaria longipes]|nr:hypothetical protein CHU98_g5675 [Xylaria longipes]